MTMPDEQPIQAEHVAIFGDSGSGKTTVARSIAGESDHAVVAAEDQSFPGRKVSDIGTLRNRVKEGKKTVFTGNGPDHTAAVMVMVAREEHVPVTLIFPESSNYLYEPKEEPPKRHNPVWWALTQGRDKGIKVVLEEQDPSDLPYTPLKQVPYFAWAGEPAGFHEGFFNHPVGNWLPDEDVLPGENHEYVVFNKRGDKEWPEDGTGPTPEEYA